MTKKKKTNQPPALGHVRKGSLILVRWGADKNQIARATAGIDDGMLHVEKWSANTKRWQKPRPVPLHDVLGRPEKDDPRLSAIRRAAALARHKASMGASSRCGECAPCQEALLEPASAPPCTGAPS